MQITRVRGREILDSRGNPTVEADVWADGALGRAAVPSGASTGAREALELRDGDATRYLGKGVRKAVANINSTSQAVIGGSTDAVERAIAAFQAAGVNASRIPVSHAFHTSIVAQISGGASADARYMLPVPMMNILNGGAHADSSVDFQEFMVMPLGAPSFAEGLSTGTDIFHALRGILKKAGH